MNWFTETEGMFDGEKIGWTGLGGHGLCIWAWPVRFGWA